MLFLCFLRACFYFSLINQLHMIKGRMSHTLSTLMCTCRFFHTFKGVPNELETPSVHSEVEDALLVGKLTFFSLARSLISSLDWLSNQSTVLLAFSKPNIS
ncbi:hypothetical protein MtrunA17_Chr4g0062681 [Medicago truncatula]|uniref:Secreted protein n=1 Tax=Medicago truncatula TaxID=3880 RepID=A0A396IE87_MEDTR|nr:hypothetical protein MtrunA17_Chr4g0062681 [Medicago truncatula]